MISYSILDLSKFSDKFSVNNISETYLYKSLLLILFISSLDISSDGSLDLSIS